MSAKKIDINSSSVEELMSLATIGRARAEAIVEARKRNGEFSSVNDLLEQVSGIGPAFIDKNRSILTCIVSSSITNYGRPLSSSPAIVSSTITSGTVRETRSVSSKYSRADTQLPLGSRSTTDLKNAELSASTDIRPTASHYTRSHTAAKLTNSEIASSSSATLPETSQHVPLAVHITQRSQLAGQTTCATGSAVVATSSSRLNPTGKTPQDIKLDLLPLFDGGVGRSGVLVADPSAESGSSSAADSVSEPSSSCSGRSATRRGRRSVAVSLRKNCLVHGGSRRPATNRGGVWEQNGRTDGEEEEEGEEGEDDEEEESQNADEGLNENETLQSRIPVSMATIDKPWMKRKMERSDDSLLPEKKLCTEVDCDTCTCTSSADDNDCGDSARTKLQKCRIPSRKNPPPKLCTWLSTFQTWSHAERLLALDELVDLCDPTQVRHVMQVIEPQFQRDFISLLPKELALYVLTFLDARDLLRASQTCRYWHTLAEDNLLWREKCQEEGVTEALVYGPQRSAKRRRGVSMIGGTGGFGTMASGNVAGKVSWKNLYIRQQMIERNWRKSTRSPKVLKGHDDHVITCLEFCCNKIVSGSDDNTLKVWSAITGKCLRTLTGHTGGVWSSQMVGNTIISGSTDRTLKVWNADTGVCVHTLYGHTSTVRCMHLHNNIVVSGSRDATLRMWDIETGHCLHVLIGHVAAVRCVQYDGRRVVSGAYDYNVKIWDPETETCLMTLSGHTNRVYSLQFDGTRIVSGSLDTSIRVWSAESGVCLHTLIGHQSLTSGMELRDNVLVSGNADSTVKVWNIATGQCLQTLQGANKHLSAVTCLQFNRTFVVTSSDDGTVKLWDLNTGEFIRNLVALESGGSGGVVWRIRCHNTKLICAVGSRNGTEETKLLVLDFDVDDDMSVQPNAAVVTRGSQTAAVAATQ